jgi:serine protease Do
MTIFTMRRFFTTGTLCLPLVLFMPSGAWAMHAGSSLPDFSHLVDRVGPAVVNIRTTLRAMPQREPVPEPGSSVTEFFQRFFGIPLPQGARAQNAAPGAATATDTGNGAPDAPSGGDDEPGQGSEVGSGFILSHDGYVMTNAHVVNNAASIMVTLTDRREFHAKLIGMDERTDVALVKIDASHLPAVTTGNSNKVRVGEWVVAIGSPFGLENTVTAGIVSAKGRDTGDYLPFIQSDVAVNPGNSGGPLINMRGEVIGINSQIYSRTGGFMGISFSIPIDEAMRVATQLKAKGRVVRGRIALETTDVTMDVVGALGLPDAQGALVTSVGAGGPADRAGILPGDIILKFNGHAIDAATDLARMTGDARPGAKVVLMIWRKGQMHGVPVIVAAMPQEQSASASEAQMPQAEPGLRGVNALGVTVGDIPGAQLNAMKLHGGVRVKTVAGPALHAGLLAGDIVLRVGNTDVTNAQQFNALIARLDAGRAVALLVRRGDNVRFVPVWIRAVAQK